MPHAAGSLRSSPTTRTSYASQRSPDDHPNLSLDCELVPVAGRRLRRRRECISSPSCREDFLAALLFLLLQKPAAPKRVANQVRGCQACERTSQRTPQQASRPQQLVRLQAPRRTPLPRRIQCGTQLEPADFLLRELIRFGHRVHRPGASKHHRAHGSERIPRRPGLPTQRIATATQSLGILPFLLLVELLERTLTRQRTSGSKLERTGGSIRR